MPALGDKARGDSLGKTGPGAATYWVFVECPICKVQRWAQPKGSYQQALNRTRHCTVHARQARRYNFNLEGSRRF